MKARFEFTFHIFISSNMLQELLCYYWHERMRFLKIPEMFNEWSLDSFPLRKHALLVSYKQAFMKCIYAETKTDTIETKMMKLEPCFLFLCRYAVVFYRCKSLFQTCIVYILISGFHLQQMHFLFSLPLNKNVSPCNLKCALTQKK